MYVATSAEGQSAGIEASDSVPGPGC
jgi:hypothetical protein